MYCSRNDVELALAPSGSDGTTGNTPISMTDAAFNDAIAAAEGTVRTYLARYAILTVLVNYPGTPTEEDPTPAPLTVEVADSAVRYWTRDIAAYYLWLTYNRGRNLEDTDPIRLRFEATIALLERIAAGDLNPGLPLAEDASEGVSGSLVVHNAYSGHLFTMDDFALGPVIPYVRGHYGQ